LFLSFTQIYFESHANFGKHREGAKAGKKSDEPVWQLNNEYEEAGD